MIEDVLEDMKTILVTNLPDELKRQQAKWAARGSNVDLGNPEILIDEENAQKIPRIRIVANSDGPASQYLSGRKDVDHDISIEVIVTDTNQKRSKQRLYRTMRAVECALEVNGPGKGSILNFRTNGMDYHAPVRSIDEVKSPEKGGIIMAIVTERVQSYTRNQT